MPPPEPPNQPDLSATSHTGDGEKDRLHLPPTPSSNGDAIKTENPKPSVSPDDGSPLKTFLLLASVFLAMFLVAVDRTIISTAIPQITNEFNSLDDVGWYGSIYLLTCCAFQLLFGKLYSIYDAKLVLLTSILIFEVASAVCGAAPTSVAFIVGRAISGVGSAGIFAGTIVTIVHSIPLAKRPRIQGLMGGIMGLATVIGPLIGGGFTSRVSWRWCFYINLPFGGVAVLAIVAFFHVPNKRPHGKLSMLQQLMLLDLPGTVALVPAVVCLLLALQWGGQQYAWNNKYIITLLTLMAVFFVAFAMAQILLPKTATVPPRLLKQRSVAAAFLTTTAVGSSQYIFVYYLPIWFQAVKGISAVQSGIHLLGLMVAFVLASITGGLLNQKIGYYTVLGIAGASMMSIGAGLLTTLQLTTTQGKMIGYQILYGFGMGLCFQTPNLATQTVLPKPEVPMGIALMFFGQLLGAAVFVAVGQNVLANQLLKRLSGVDAFDKLKPLILSGGATSVVDAAPSAQRSMVLAAYNSALRQVFIVGLVLSCLAVLGTATMEWKSILKKPQPEAGVAQQTGASAKASADGKV